MSKCFGLQLNVCQFFDNKVFFAFDTAIPMHMAVLPFDSMTLKCFLYLYVIFIAVSSN